METCRCEESKQPLGERRWRRLNKNEVACLSCEWKWTTEAEYVADLPRISREEQKALEGSTSTG